MSFLYSFGIVFYGLALRVASLFNKKAAQWIHGRKTLFTDLENAIREPSLNRNKKKLVWFHCASLGEFEQGRPLIETFRNTHPAYIILLTFFSPSGYELRKNYKGADLIFYLPLDTQGNANCFLNIVMPDIVFFVKYEFWFNYLRELQTRNIPHYLVSAIFRADQHFFKWYGNWPKSVLKGFTYIFVQNQYSKELLELAGIANATVSGDTRFDRVTEIAGQNKEFPIVKAFTNNEFTLVAGSTWPADEELIIRYMIESGESCKLIVAPHEIRKQEIVALCNRFGEEAILYSEADLNTITSYQVLIIDSIGMLSQLYRFGKIAYIGGGFGAGIHNTLEAAVYGIPVCFGPNYQKFQEAMDLIERKGAFVIQTYSDLENILNTFRQSTVKLEITAEICLNYISEKRGATNHIMNAILIP